ncbi:related to zinc-binding oxidoreductase [Fusarium fujikuroi]|uniref:Related to zinc-binding oxidoreductase n=1 Tax=Gibberella fujikuroi (strain CBS 195.34 / IMI 58289 / NRRL A-6831) TaxID=1279085 RepID=S0E8E6_GIBF5|nr:related to zinc-binding oxidoreductase [Fusarium fujikuroi IMI 58289]KLO99171.1 zinc-binding oxidoreductase [Fusarium fujikuroi]CCT70915.1 related to zinc-binding oxidoreductase [Fusarium fujikuroi IMI 58289]SCN96853.1 related to zinc-binding oxidoreductase [Fusarium fujikuroi]SCO02687.1 related to zinc-binding oxidoreductase [Fusarium fujikuroi]SCO14119.1 related to zinc-binding oxidoreductase [Fusarium fujikuroi]
MPHTVGCFALTHHILLNYLPQINMSLPETYRAFRRTTGDFPRTVEPSIETVPRVLGPNDVLIKVHAVSLNFRDVAMLNGIYPMTMEDRGIPCSDAAAEVVAAGSAVEGFVTGDHVSVISDLNNITGSEDEPLYGLGGDTAGVLREYAVYQDKHLVKLPRHLSWEEAATITIAGVTAWTALDGLTTASKSRSALMQGTGGVSMFALLICLAAGIQPIITSSSDEKLEAVKKLDPRVRGINYKTTQDQGAEVRRLTDGQGVDFVINNAGPGSVPQDISFLRQRGGTVSLVGFLGGIGGDWQPAAIMALMAKSAKIKGIAVGSKEDYINLNRFLEEKKVSLSPLVDRVFSFEESPAAFEYLYSGKHAGKVIIKI